MSDAWIIAMPSIGLAVVSLLGLVTLVPYLDGRQEVRLDKWIRSHAIAWVCYKRGKRDAHRRRYKLLDRYEARKEEA